MKKILFFSWSLTTIATVLPFSVVDGTCWIPTEPTRTLSSQRPTWAFLRQRRRAAGLHGIEAKRSSSSSSSASSSLKKQQQKQPSLSDALNRIHRKNRLPVDIDTTRDACPCGGLGRSDRVARPYRECCAKFHDAAVFYLEQQQQQQQQLDMPSNSSLCWPDSPRQLLASRYTAFFYRWPAYIMATTHESSRDYRPPAQYMDWCLALDRDGMFDALDFVSLTVEDEEDVSDDASEAYISFVVTLQEKQKKAKRPAKKAGFGKVATTPSPRSQVVEIWERSHFLRDSTGRWKYASGQVRTGSGGSGSVLLNT
jgi:uncharacterized protein YchJ